MIRNRTGSELAVVLICLRLDHQHLPSAGDAFERWVAGLIDRLGRSRQVFSESRNVPGDAAGGGRWSEDRQACPQQGERARLWLFS